MESYKSDTSISAVINFSQYFEPIGRGPFTPFATRDDAAADFGLFIGKKSIDEEEEYAAAIYQEIDENGNLYFFYDIPRNDLDTHEERSISFSISWDNIYGSRVAITHTHGAYDADTYNTKDGFSSADNVLSGDPEKSDAYFSDLLEIDYYLVAPNGSLRLYIENSGNYEGELIRTDMIVDSRIAIHRRMENTLLWKLLFSNFPNATAQNFVNARRNNPNSLFNAINDLERFR